MKNSLISALVAVVAIVANGCAGGTDSATMEVPSGITLAPIGENTRVSASFDLPLAGAASDGVLATGGVMDGAGLSLAPVRGCAVASASSDTMATAQFLSSCTRGALVEAAAGQYFVFNPEADVDYSIGLVSDGDARFDLGVSTVTPRGDRTCSVFSAGVVSIRFSASEAVGDLCVVVRSDSGSAQAFRLGLAH